MSCAPKARIVTRPLKSTLSRVLGCSDAVDVPHTRVERPEERGFRAHLQALKLPRRRLQVELVLYLHTTIDTLTK